jgi:hypothetical protein
MRRMKRVVLRQISQVKSEGNLSCLSKIRTRAKRLGNIPN